MDISIPTRKITVLKCMSISDSSGHALPHSIVENLYIILSRLWHYIFSCSLSKF